MNRYDAELVADGHNWRISRLTANDAWFESDPAIVTFKRGISS